MKIRIERIPLLVVVIIVIALIILQVVVYAMTNGDPSLESLLFMTSVLGIVAIIISACTSMQLRIDGLGITYQHGLRKETITWNNLTHVRFEILPRPDYDHVESWLQSHPPMEYGDRPYIPYPRQRNEPRKAPPEFQCSMTFTGNRVIRFRTGMTHGPSKKEFFAAWDYIRLKQQFHDFESEMERLYPRGYKGLPKLLKPV